MSFLLSALRKSGKAAREGAEPGIPGKDVPGGSRWTRSELAMHLAWIVPTCALLIWLGLHQLVMSPDTESATPSPGHEMTGPGAGDAAARPS